MQIITFNVGGTLFSFKKETLLETGENYLTSLFDSKFRSTERDDNGNYFLDMCPKTFHYISLRIRGYDLPRLYGAKLKNLQKDAEFLSLQNLFKPRFLLSFPHNMIDCSIYSMDDKNFPFDKIIKEYQLTQIVFSLPNEKEYIKVLTPLVHVNIDVTQKVEYLTILSNDDRRLIDEFSHKLCCENHTMQKLTYDANFEIIFEDGRKSRKYEGLCYLLGTPILNLHHQNIGRSRFCITKVYVPL